MVIINGQQIKVTKLQDFLQTKEGMQKALDYLESQKVNYKPAKDHKK